jgi:mannose-6-phosphate isomerase
MISKPVRLEPSPRKKVWGATHLAPWYPNSDEKTGEIWFLPPEGVKLPILVKFIYTSAPLSVQVHPDDAYAAEHEGQDGKTEMAYILRAEPGASMALGLNQPVTRERLREAALSGEIEHMLGSFPVAPGEVYFTPPGTVHAIGAGLALCEIQQNTDLTYRLYDYGRPRELHLDKAVEAALLTSHPGRSQPGRLPEGRQLLAQCDYFVAERWTFDRATACHLKRWSRQQLIVIEGNGLLGDEEFETGEVWLIPSGEGEVVLYPSGPVTVLCAYMPSR